MRPDLSSMLSEWEVAPACAGTGLVALDVVLADVNEPSSARLETGGSCGNVLLGLAYLGWKVSPLGRLKSDRAAELIVEDFKEWNADLRFLERSSDGSTPIIVQVIRQTKSGPRHRFLFTCPHCGGFLPKFKPILQARAANLGPSLGPAGFFYFDRVSPGSLALAQHYNEAGTTVVFEPSGVKDDVLFGKCLAASHILKYSSERLPELDDLELPSSVRVQVETLGEEGLRYRYRQPKGVSPWQQLSAYPTTAFKDAAGAGDWCTIGMISALERSRSADGRVSWARSNVESALRFGQALAAANCEHVGARGLMSLNRKQLHSRLEAITGGSSIDALEAKAIERVFRELMATLCADCSREDVGDSRARAGRHRHHRA